MKNLKEYINYNFENYLLESLAFHISVENKIRNPYRIGIKLYESLLFESLGRFDNCGKCAEYIVNKLKDNPIKQIIDCSEFKVFFNKLNISNIEYSKIISAAYIGTKNDAIEIELQIPKVIDDSETEERIMYVIIHELLHAYEDYNRINNGKESIFDLFNNSYINSFKGINSIFDIKKYISRCKYFLDDKERNAYFGELYPMIEKIIRDKKLTLKNLDYSKFVNEIKNTDIWKIYFEIGDFILKIKNDSFNEKDKNEIINIYSNITGKESKYSEIKKDLFNKWKKFNSKFNQLVPKIICDILMTPYNMPAMVSEDIENYQLI